MTRPLATGTTIFTTMSALAQEHGAVNLGQGLPDFDCDPVLQQRVTAAMAAGHNQYAPMAGVPLLRARIAAKVQQLYGRAYDAEREVTVTAGATQAILTAVLALAEAGDEVMVLEPCFDSYIPNILLAGATVVRVPLRPGGFRPDFDAIAAALTPRTRIVIVNSPHNPTGTIWTRADFERLAAVLESSAALVISDEVYEHMVFDGAAHVSVASVPELAARAVVVSSFGKTYHVTGWKVGYALAPAELMAAFRAVHQYNVFSVNTPMQHALAEHLADAAPYLGLAAFYQEKRDRFRAGLADTRLRPLHTEGSYFQLADYSAVSALPEAAFCEWLTREIGVAAIPVSAFYGTPVDQGLVRLCFAKREATLAAALERLRRL